MNNEAGIIQELFFSITKEKKGRIHDFQRIYISRRYFTETKQLV